jgi:hypothetical protein
MSIFSWLECRTCEKKSETTKRSPEHLIQVIRLYKHRIILSVYSLNSDYIVKEMVDSEMFNFIKLHSKHFIHVMTEGEDGDLRVASFP